MQQRHQKRIGAVRGTETAFLQILFGFHHHLAPLVAVGRRGQLRFKAGPLLRLAVAGKNRIALFEELSPFPPQEVPQKFALRIRIFRRGIGNRDRINAVTPGMTHLVIDAGADADNINPCTVAGKFPVTRLDPLAGYGRIRDVPRFNVQDFPPLPDADCRVIVAGTGHVHAHHDFALLQIRRIGIAPDVAEPLAFDHRIVGAAGEFAQNANPVGVRLLAELRFHILHPLPGLPSAVRDRHDIPQRINVGITVLRVRKRIRAGKMQTVPNARGTVERVIDIPGVGSRIPHHQTETLRVPHRAARHLENRFRNAESLLHDVQAVVKPLQRGRIVGAGGAQRRKPVLPFAPVVKGVAGQLVILRQNLPFPLIHVGNLRQHDILQLVIRRPGDRNAAGVPRPFLRIHVPVHQNPDQLRLADAVPAPDRDETVFRNRVQNLRLLVRRYNPAALNRIPQRIPGPALEPERQVTTGLVNRFRRDDHSGTTNSLNSEKSSSRTSASPESSRAYFTASPSPRRNSVQAPALSRFRRLRSPSTTAC